MLRGVGCFAAMLLVPSMPLTSGCFGDGDQSAGLDQNDWCGIGFAWRREDLTAAGPRHEGAPSRGAAHPPAVEVLG